MDQREGAEDHGMTGLPLLYRALWIYLAAVSVTAFAAYGADKRRAVRDRRRIRERTLILLAAAGGSAGALAGMLVFRHKIRKPKFYIGVPFIFVVQAALVCYIIFRSRI